MTRKTDADLGMHAAITRRDLIHDAGVATAAMALDPANGAAAADKGMPAAADYPPVRTGLRGSHPGAFEAAHALARGVADFPTRSIWISTLIWSSSGRVYRDWPRHISTSSVSAQTCGSCCWKTTTILVAMRERKQFRYGQTAANSPAMWFDAETYGESRLVARCDLTGRPDPATKDGAALRITAGHCVLACYHRIIPHLCPTLPQRQREALEYQLKHPLLLTNVLIRSTDALDRLGIDGVRCPGRLMERLFTLRGINTGGVEHAINDSGPVALVFWGSISPPAYAVNIRTQLRASRSIMLDMTFEDYEREVRTVLDGLLGPAGFDVQRDILAITVNRWPHGYAYEYLDLWDPDWPEGEAPHELARKVSGRIAIANTDAAATAYTHTAIDQAWRAVQDLPA